MPKTSSDERQHAHRLIDELPAKQLRLIVNLLEGIVDAAAGKAGEVPEEEEALKPEMAAVLERARASLARGEGISHEEILREFGLKE